MPQTNSRWNFGILMIPFSIPAIRSEYCLESGLGCLEFIVLKLGQAYLPYVSGLDILRLGLGEANFSPLRFGFDFRFCLTLTCFRDALEQLAGWFLIRVLRNEFAAEGFG